MCWVKQVRLQLFCWLLQKETWFSFSMANLEEMSIQYYTIYFWLCSSIHGSLFVGESHAGSFKHSEHSLTILDQSIRQSRTCCRQQQDITRNIMVALKWTSTLSKAWTYDSNSNSYQTVRPIMAFIQQIWRKSRWSVVVGISTVPCSNPHHLLHPLSAITEMGI